MRVMLLGSGGLLGHDLATTVPTDVVLLSFPHPALDITDAEALEAAVAQARPAVIMNAAAYTAVDRAEAEPEAAYRVNAVAVASLGRIAVRHGARVVHFSTDYVFDGATDRPYREDDPPEPVNSYGASKLAGERFLQESSARHLIVRTQWLFGQHGRSFPGVMLQRARDTVPTRVVNDQIGRPTFALDLARVVWRLIHIGADGLYHVTNSGMAAWSEVAFEVFSHVGCAELLSTCSASEYPTAARRPKQSCLDTQKLFLILGHEQPHWKDALGRFLTNA